MVPSSHPPALAPRAFLLRLCRANCPACPPGFPHGKSFRPAQPRPEKTQCGKQDSVRLHKTGGQSAVTSRRRRHPLRRCRRYLPPSLWICAPPESAMAWRCFGHPSALPPQETIAGREATCLLRRHVPFLPQVRRSDFRARLPAALCERCRSRVPCTSLLHLRAGLRLDPFPVQAQAGAGGQRRISSR
jgi:hypothetical protein